jgi:acetyl-CoA carboxylase carboxyl transferase subunit alpha
VLILGNEKGNDMESRIFHNFGMAKPEGYRKSQRIMKLAEKLQLPLLLFIDTSGAYPGKDAEERGQAEAIAKSMQTSLNMNSPCISIIIGEGGSGGAIALGTSDRVLMLSNSIYSVISPEGCSSILWKSSDFSKIAANALKITANDCFKLKIIDEIVDEPIGGAHREVLKTCSILKETLLSNLKILNKINLSELRISRSKRYLDYVI